MRKSQFQEYAARGYQVSILRSRTG